MKTKGQIAFESLLVLLLIITSATMITALYLQFHDETIALGYAKIGTLEELSKQEENVIIEKISIQRIGLIPTITISLDRTATIDTEKIKNIIKAKTSLKNIEVQVEVVRQ